MVKTPFLLPLTDAATASRAGSAALAYVYFKSGPFIEGFLYHLSTRSVQFLITVPVEVVILRLLFQSKVFNTIGLWPPKAKEK